MSVTSFRAAGLVSLLALLPCEILASPLPSTTTASASATPFVKSAVATSYPAPIPCIGEACTTVSYSIQDSNIIRHTNGTLFRFSKSTGRNTGLTLSTAPKLYGPWVRQPDVLVPETSHLQDYLANGTQYPYIEQWAPEVHYINGEYVLYYTVNNNITGPFMDVAVATSPNMSTGSWTDHGSVGLPADSYVGNGWNWPHIDLNLVSSYADSSPSGPSNDTAGHVVWGSYNAGLFGTTLESNNPLKVVSGKPTLHVQDQPTPISSTTYGNRTEASFHYQVGSYVYYFFSTGNCCTASTAKTAYSTYVCRSTNGSEGPYYDMNGLNCAGNEDGSTNGSGTMVLTSHMEDSNGKYEVFSPGSVGITVCSS